VSGPGLSVDNERIVLRYLVEHPTARVDELTELVRSADPLLDAASLADSLENLVARARGFGPIGPLFHDPTVSEVMINGPGTVWVDRSGKPEQTSVVVSSADIAVLIERIVDPLCLRVDRLSPFVDARLPDGSRVNIVIPPLAVDGPIVTLRRFSVEPVELDRFGPPVVQELLRRLVEGRAAIVVVGGTGAGKTTLLNAMAAHINPDERIVTVEDTAELQLPGRHVVRLEARQANQEGVGEVTIGQLVRNALRMRPDRLVIGEVRGGEALDLLLALNTGHQGSLTTCHANDPLAGLRRLETLALFGGVDLPLEAIRRQLIAGLDIVVQVGRARSGEMNRQVLAIAEVDPHKLALRELWPHTAGPAVRDTVKAALSTC